MATLEELDAWGTIDSAAINAYTLEQLDDLTLHSASAAASLAMTASCTPNKFTFVSDSVSIAITASAAAVRVFECVGNLLVSMTAAAAATRYAIPSIDDITISMTASDVDTVTILKMGGTGELIFTSTLTGEILGETWSNVAAGGESWSEVVAGSETWTEATTTASEWSSA